MARIEITLDEYNGLKEKIATLENNVAILDKNLEDANSIMNAQKDALDYMLDGITSLERIFQWKKIVKAVKESLN